MTTFSELDDRTSAAWAAYHAATSGLQGTDYDETEQLAWASLQADLQGIDAERAELLAGAGTL